MNGLLRLVWLWLLLSVAVTAVADGLTARSRIALVRPERLTLHGAPGSRAVDCLVQVRNAASIDSLQRHGAVVYAIAGDVLTARIPVAALHRVAAIDGVQTVSIEHRLTLCNDSARHFAQVDAVHAGIFPGIAYKGIGVIVGVIDTGVDFNHINLCDTAGKSRVRAAYLPCDDSGTAPIVWGGRSLPGSHYDTPEQIAALTTDNDHHMHGTHTTGTAAGGYTANGWHGVAPEADIVIAAMPEDQLTDANILNAISYIADYAARVNKPCVVNLSLGSSDGPHDGTSLLCRALDEFSDMGRIFVLAAGNDAGVRMHHYHELAGEGDAMRTFMQSRAGSYTRLSGALCAWDADGDTPHFVTARIIDSATGEVLYETPTISEQADDETFEVSSDDDEALAAVFDGALAIGTAVEVNERFHSVVEAGGTLRESTYRLEVTYAAPEHRPVRLRVFGEGAVMSADGRDDHVDGDDSMTISDMATGLRTISVGAFCSRRSMVRSTGVTTYYPGSTPYDIASFSSYGPDARGTSRPDIVAPGYAVVSSTNRYYEDRHPERVAILPSPAVVNGESYPYVSMWGTSMAAPMVTGAIALLLQEEPRLDAAAVRELLTATATRDEWVINGNPEQWGAGKLNVQGAMELLLSRRKPGDVNADGVVNATDVAAIVNVIAGIESPEYYHGRADVNGDHAVNATDIAQVITLIAGVE